MNSGEHDRGQTQEGEESDTVGDGCQDHATGQGRVDPQPLQGHGQRGAVGGGHYQVDDPCDGQHPAQDLITEPGPGQRALADPTCPSAMPRITSVNVWVPAMPPMLATTGISTASATTFSSVCSNRPTTADARNAVARLMPSQTARRRVERSTGAKVSSYSSRPAMLISEWSAPSRITSTTSSTVIRPSSRPSLSTTGALTRSSRSKMEATSLADWSARIAVASVIIASRTSMTGSFTSSVVSGRRSEE